MLRTSLLTSLFLRAARLHRATRWLVGALMLGATLSSAQPSAPEKVGAPNCSVPGTGALVVVRFSVQPPANAPVSALASSTT